MAQWKQIRQGTMRFRVRSLASLSRLRILHCCELWCRPAATARIRRLAWEPPHAMDVALKRQKTKKKKKKEKEKKEKWSSRRGAVVNKSD